ncbi:MAG: amidohydrolase [Candidatus Rokubacteria bacterium]|nr:amidohydrolase [Candidatus Rokubacteria bacterium]MBI3824535.1 amidohydrolase [Candidatus Rokubacteria bacterium]
MRLVPDLVLTPGGWRAAHAVDLAGGRIVAVEPAGAARAGDVALAGRALLPGTVNAHCHTFQSLLRGLGDDLDFMGWRDRVLYPFSTRLDRKGIALGAQFAFAEMLLHGATTCVDFFYLTDAGNENAEAVIAAAHEIGIRLVLARTMYDWEGAPGRYRETPPDAARRTRELVESYRGDATVSVQPAPHSPHGASPAMIRAGFEVAEAAGTPFHIHVAEGRYEGEHTLREHGATPIRYLERLGVLGPRTIGVHCVWLDDEEIALMGARGAALAYCPSSNMFLGDGVTRVPEMLRAGVRIGLGTDGGCTNNRLSVFEEMRMTSLLQRVRLLDGTALSAGTAFALGTSGGAGILGLEAGAVAAGRLADLVAVDLEDASLHPRTDLVKSVVYAMSPRAITDVWVHGRHVVAGRRLATVDEDDLLARVRELTRGWSI